MRKGMWSPEEDEKLTQFLSKHDFQCWNEVPKKAGLRRCGKSCRLRWINYLRPGLNRSKFSSEEKNLVMELHKIHGNRWTKIAKHLEGRTDNDVKNLWHSQTRMHNGKLNIQKVTIPNEPVHLSGIMSSISTKQIQDEQVGLTSGNAFTMQQKSMPNVFPFILDLDSYNIGNPSKLDPNQQCSPLKYIEKALPSMDISEGLGHILGVHKSYAIGHPFSTSFMTINDNTSDLELESGEESKNHSSHMIVDNNLINFSGLLELDANHETSMINMILENLENMFNDSYEFSKSIRTNNYEDEKDESLNQVLPWHYNQNNSNKFSNVLPSK